MWKVFEINTIKRVPDCKSFEVCVYNMSLPTASGIKMESHLHKIFQFPCSERLTVLPECGGGSLAGGRMLPSLPWDQPGSPAPSPPPSP